MRNRSTTDNGGASAAGAHPTPAGLNAYLDGFVPEDERAQIALHLGSCAACRAELVGLRATTALLRALPEPRLRRSFQLGPEQARTRGSVWDRLGLRLLPALPGLRAATVAVALLLAGVTAADLLDEERAGGPVSDEMPRVVSTSTAVNDPISGNNALTTSNDAPDGAIPTAIAPADPAIAAAAPTTAETRQAEAESAMKAPAPEPAADESGGGALAADQQGEAAASEADVGDDTVAQDAAPTNSAHETFEIAVDTDEPMPDDPATGAQVADGDALEEAEAAFAAPSDATAGRSASEPTGGAIAPAAGAEQSLFADTAATAEVALASPIAVPSPAPAATPAASPTPAGTPAPPATPAASDSRSVSGTSADDAVSGWRIAQVASGALLLLLVGALLVIRRVRPRTAR